MSRERSRLSTVEHRLEHKSGSLEVAAVGELSDALSAALMAAGAGELQRLLSALPGAQESLYERATLDGMLAVASVLAKTGLRRELLTFRTFALGTGIRARSSHIRSMGSEQLLEKMAERLFGDVLAVTPKTAAKALSCSTSQVYWLLKTGKLNSVRLGDGKQAGQRVLVVSLIQFIASGGVGNATPTPAAQLATRQGRRGPAGALL